MNCRLCGKKTDVNICDSCTTNVVRNDKTRARTHVCDKCGKKQRKALNIFRGELICDMCLVGDYDDSDLTVDNYYNTHSFSSCALADGDTNAQQKVSRQGEGQ